MTNNEESDGEELATCNIWNVKGRWSAASRGAMRYGVEIHQSPRALVKLSDDSLALRSGSTLVVTPYSL